MKRHKILIPLIVEGTEDGFLFGRVHYDDNLMVDSAKTIESLENKFRRLLFKFHKIKPTLVMFDLHYDIAGLFDQKKYLNASVVADRAGISRGLMRQYIAGLKYPSFERTYLIQKTVQELGRELQNVKVAVRKAKSL